jgi:hypothetical protein
MDGRDQGWEQRIRDQITLTLALYIPYVQFRLEAGPRLGGEGDSHKRYSAWSA